MGWQMKWYARSSPCCRGRSFVGPKAHWLLPVTVVTNILLGIAGWIYMQNLMTKDVDSLILFVLYLVTTSLTLMYFLFTSYSDPGIMFRHKDYEYFKQQYDERKA